MGFFKLDAMDAWASRSPQVAYQKISQITLTLYAMSLLVYFYWVPNDPRAYFFLGAAGVTAMNAFNYQYTYDERPYHLREPLSLACFLPLVSYAIMVFISNQPLGKEASSPDLSVVRGTPLLFGAFLAFLVHQLWALTGDRQRSKHRASKIMRFDEESRYRTAMHEIGHAFLYAHPKWRQGFDHAVALSTCKEDEAWGFCQGTISGVPKLSEKSNYLYWRGLVSLAGEESVFILTGEKHSLGGGSDLAKWQVSTWKYLKIQADSVMNEPTYGQWQMKRWQKELFCQQITDAMNDVKQQQRRELGAFFQENAEVFLEATIALFQQQALNSDELEGYFDRVVWPDCWTVPAVVKLAPYAHLAKSQRLKKHRQQESQAIEG